MMRQCGIDPSSSMTLEGEFQSPDEATCEGSLSESDESSEKADDVSIVPKDDPPSDSQETAEHTKIVARSKRKIGTLQMLKLKFRAKCKKLAQAREVGANPASRKRDLEYATGSLVKLWLLSAVMTSSQRDCAHERFDRKAKCTITLHTANGPTVTEYAVNLYVKELCEHIIPCTFE